MSTRRLSALLALIFVCVTTVAFAQDADKQQQSSGSSAPTVIRRGYFSLNGGYQVTSNTFTNAWSFPYAAETASVSASYPLKAGFLFDVGGGVRVHRNLTVGASVSRYGSSVPVAFSGTVPHPLYYNQPRSFSQEMTGLSHNETGVHFNAMWTLEASKTIQVGIFGGPSVFFVNQTLIGSPAAPAEQSGYFVETYPFDTVQVGNTATTPRSKTAIGVNAGADITYLLSSQMNLGILLRYTHAGLQFATDASNDAIPVTVGGMQVGFGLRYRF